MTDELDLDLNDSQETINREQKRNKDLSDKVKLTSQERDEALKAKEEAESAKNASIKEVEFYKNFSTISSKYQGATEFQDKIKEKVAAGYDLEDATVAVLNKEGRFLPSETQVVDKKSSPAGGSATTSMKGGGDKTIQEMSKSEKREELEKLLV